MGVVRPSSGSPPLSLQCPPHLFSNRLIPCFSAGLSSLGSLCSLGWERCPPRPPKMFGFTVVEDSFMAFLDGWSPLWAAVCLLQAEPSEPPTSDATQGQGPVNLPLVLSCLPGFSWA